MAHSVTTMEFQRTCDSLRDLVKQMSFNKATGMADSEAVLESSSKAMKYLLQLKEDLRLSSVATEKLKDQTTDSQADLDELNLQLQNLLYEKLYYEKEIRACMHFPSQFTDAQIGLVSLEEFQQQHPAEAESGNSHFVMLKRLLAELAERKALLARRDELQGKRSELHKKFQTLRSNVEGVARMLNDLDTASSPLQRALAPQAKLVSLSGLSEHLPLPLYIIYSQLAATSRNLPVTATVDIVGSMEQAQEFNSSYQEGPAAKRLRTDTAGTAGDTDVAQAHPLSVHLTVQTTESPIVTAKVCFQFLPNLRLVTAACPQDPQLLPNLFPGDTGDLQLAEVLQQAASAGKIVNSLPSGAKPYRWVQQLGGLDFLSTLPLMGYLQPGQRSQLLQGFAEYRGQQRVETLLQLLLARKASLQALNSMLARPRARPSKLLTPPAAIASPSPPRATLASWSEVKASSSSSGGARSGAASPSGPASRSGAASPSGPAPLLLEAPRSAANGTKAVRVLDLAAQVAEAVRSAPSSRMFAAEFRTQPPGNTHSWGFDTRLKVFMEYPSRAPAVHILKVSELTLDSKGAVTSSRNTSSSCINDILWIQRQVNCSVLQQLGACDSPDAILACQVDRLRHCMDDVAQRLATEASTSDLTAKLAIRQQLSGRDRCGGMALMSG